MPLGSVVDDGLQRLNVGDVHRSDIEAESAIGELVSARLEPGLIDIQYQYPPIIGCHNLRDAQPQSAGTAVNDYDRPAPVEDVAGFVCDGCHYAFLVIFAHRGRLDP